MTGAHLPWIEVSPRYWHMLIMAAIAADESIQQVKLKYSLLGVGNSISVRTYANVYYLHSL
jgi:hypothetical protein